VLGPGRRLRHVLVDPAAGNANDGDPGQDSGCGPNSDAAGQVCGPRSSSGGRWSTARARLRAIVDRARRYEAIREEPGLTQGQLAAREGVSGPRVNQVLSMLRLHEAILVELTDPERDTPVPSLDELFAIGKLPDARSQVARYRAVFAALEGKRNDLKVAAGRQRGFQHLFVQALAFHAALDRGEYRSIAALARAHGLSHSRVEQVLDLLTLPVEVQVTLDVPAERLPRASRRSP
jgi:Winged helix-turn-helix DNA-binding